MTTALLQEMSCKLSQTEKPRKPSNDRIIGLQPALKYHSCSYSTFFSNLSSIPPKDIMSLISKYYIPKQTSIKNLDKQITDTIEVNNVHCERIPIPSWHLTHKDYIGHDYIKRIPSRCPYFPQHITLELLWWLMVILIFNIGSNMGSYIILFIFYSVIQCVICCMGYFSVDGIYRCKHIVSVPLYDKEKRVECFNDIFNTFPTIKARMEQYSPGMNVHHNLEIVTKELVINECMTLIDPDIGEENEEYLDWIYCIEYETDIDFIDDNEGLKFKDLCIKFIIKNSRNYVNTFSIKIIQDMIAKYNTKYWCGYIMIINSRSNIIIPILRFIMKLLNVLCLSLLYRIPLYLSTKKKLKIVKYLGFGDST